MSASCMNCGRALTSDDLVVMHRRKIVAGACETCTTDVRKPRVTLTRKTKTGDFEPEQYSAVEVFR